MAIGYVILKWIVIRIFLEKIVYANRWRYLVVIALCFIYSFGISLAGPKWYRADAVLAFKNRAVQSEINLSRLMVNPLPLFLEEEPIEQQYDLTNLIYSRNLADRVIGERFDELYDPEEYDSITDFYEKFMLKLGFNYDGELNIITLSYTYKDPELAAQFCNDYALALEQFMIEVVQKHRASTVIRRRLEEALEEARLAEIEIAAISGEYNVTDLLQTPKHWLISYAEALERSYLSEAQIQSLLAALSQLRENRNRRNLLSEPQGAPDTTIIKDIITAGLRFRLAMINTMIDISVESLTEDSSALEQLRSESGWIQDYLSEQYLMGIEVESETVLLALNENILKNYLHQARVEMTYNRLMELPGLEADIRPAIRRHNLANATVSTLDKLLAMTEVGEEYGVHPIQVIDHAMVPIKPIQPAWNQLQYLIPTMLFISTLWFGFVHIYISSSNE